MLGSIRKHTLGGPPPPPKKKRSYPEGKIQAAIVKWLRARPDWMVIACENAARRTRAQVARAKALGMQPGAPDLVLLYKCDVVWFETKTPTGSLSDEQLIIHTQLRARRQAVLTAYGEADALAQLEGYARAVDARQSAPGMLREWIGRSDKVDMSGHTYKQLNGEALRLEALPRSREENDALHDSLGDVASRHLSEDKITRLLLGSSAVEVRTLPPLELACAEIITPLERARRPVEISQATLDKLRAAWKAQFDVVAIDESQKFQELFYALGAKEGVQFGPDDMPPTREQVAKALGERVQTVGPPPAMADAVAMVDAEARKALGYSPIADAVTAHVVKQVLIDVTKAGK